MKFDIMHLTRRIVLFFINCAFSALPKYPITLSENGYEGVTIYISDVVKGDNKEQYYIQNIKDMMTYASSALYTASKRHVYFKNITIVLPKDWKTDTGENFISGPQFDLSHIIIDQGIHHSRPAVFGMTECGAQAQYMSIPYKTVLDVPYLYTIEKAIVHEWAHFRWGIFDEYPETEMLTTDVSPIAYTDSGTFKPNTCSSYIQGEFLLDCREKGSSCAIGDNGLPEGKCKFCPFANNTAKASLMGYQWLQSIAAFCEDEDADDPSVRHNILANTRQNKHCNMKSAWEVMRTHSDFKGTQPGSKTQDITPSFLIVKQGLIQTVLVLDVSGSMRGDKLENLVIACTDYLQSRVKDGTVIGIVTFNTTAQVVHPMTLVRSDYDRDDLVKVLPKVAKGGTSIGAGILKAVEILRKSGNVVKGSYLILVSDGENTDSPSIQDVKSDVINSGVIVTSLAFTEQSDINMVALAAATGGQSFFISGTVESTTLIDVFTQGLEIDDGSDTVLSQLQSLAISISPSEPYSGSFVIDSSIGRNTEIKLTGKDVSNIMITVTSNANATYVSSQTSGRRLSLKLPEIIETGIYSFVLESSDAMNNVILSIQSNQLDAQKEAIVARTWTSTKLFDLSTNTNIKIFASVFKGRSPIINSHVTAVIEDNMGAFRSISLDDNGSGSDLLRDDGIYSAYLLPSHLKENGRHSIKLIVSSIQNKTQLLVQAETYNKRKRRNVNQTEDLMINNTRMAMEVVPFESFQRISLGEDFIVSNFDYQSMMEVDKIAPSRITTLRVLNSTGNLFTLTWTAVGDDLDVGTASSYKIKVGETFKDLITDNTIDSDTLNMTIPRPQLSGEVESVTVALPDQNVTYFICVRAIDSEGNEGMLSNVISLSAIYDARWLAPLSKQSNKPKPDAETKHENKQITLPTRAIIGISLSVVSLILIVIFILCYIKRRRGTFNVEREMVPVPTEEV